jgi:hypothetical protein
MMKFFNHEIKNRLKPEAFGLKPEAFELKPEAFELKPEAFGLKRKRIYINH